MAVNPGQRRPACTMMPCLWSYTDGRGLSGTRRLGTAVRPGRQAGDKGERQLSSSDFSVHRRRLGDWQVSK